MPKQLRYLRCYILSYTQFSVHKAATPLALNRSNKTMSPRCFQYQTYSPFLYLAIYERMLKLKNHPILWVFTFEYTQPVSLVYTWKAPECYENKSSISIRTFGQRAILICFKVRENLFDHGSVSRWKSLWQSQEFSSVQHSIFSTAVCKANSRTSILFTALNSRYKGTRTSTGQLRPA